MNELKLPFYAKMSLTLLGIMLLGYLVYIGQNIIVPLAFALFLSILLLPFCSFMERHGLPRWVAIIICVLTLFIGVGLIIYFISTQLMSFSEAAPDLKVRLQNHLHILQQWLGKTFGFSDAKQTQWFNEKLNEFYASSDSYLKGTVDAITSFFIFIGLIPVYIILLLHYRDHLNLFFVQVFGKREDKKVHEILHETRGVIQSYISGLLREALIVATLNCIGLLVVGLPYAILIGVIAAMLNVIPYIGGLVAILLAVAMALVSHESLLYPLLVMAILLVVQFIDNHVIIPNVVASKVRLNALVSIVVVLIGGALCGVWGMFLSIPFTAILKIIFDRVDGLKPWGALLGSGDNLVGKGIKIKIKLK